MALDKRQLPEVDRNVRNRKYFYNLNSMISILTSAVYAYVNVLSLYLSLSLSLSLGSVCSKYLAI